MLMEKTKLPKHYKRTWLNEEGSGYIITEASVCKHWSSKGKGIDRFYIDADVEIKDCNRQINLEFYCNNKEQYEKRLVKLQLMIDQLEEVKAFMLANPVTHTQAEEDEEDDDS